jgi:hypothetical protein
VISGAVQHFFDPLLYQKVFHAADVELLPTARGKFNARLTQIRLNKIWMQRADESLPRVLRGTVSPFDICGCGVCISCGARCCWPHRKPLPSPGPRWTTASGNWDDFPRSTVLCSASQLPRPCVGCLRKLRSSPLRLGKRSCLMASRSTATATIHPSCPKFSSGFPASKDGGPAQTRTQHHLGVRLTPN